MNETVRTSTIGTGGTLATITLVHYNEIMAAIAGTATAAYMIFKCWDWLEKRIQKRKQMKEQPDDD